MGVLTGFFPSFRWRGERGDWRSREKRKEGRLKSVSLGNGSSHPPLKSHTVPTKAWDPGDLTYFYVPG